MPSNYSPKLGSIALQNPSPHLQTVHVSPSTCQDLSLFKGMLLHAAYRVTCSLSETDILREYRRLDDTIIMRLNRANAAMRDQQREHNKGSRENVQNQACAYLWHELVGKDESGLVHWALTLWAWHRKLETKNTTRGVLHSRGWSIIQGETRGSWEWKCGPWTERYGPNNSVCQPGEGIGTLWDLDRLWGSLSSA